MSQDELQALDGILAEIFREEPPISTNAVPPPITPSSEPSDDEPPVQDPAIKPPEGCGRSRHDSGASKGGIGCPKSRHRNPAPLGDTRHQSQANKTIPPSTQATWRPRWRGRGPLRNSKRSGARRCRTTCAGPYQTADFPWNGLFRLKMNLGKI